MHDLKHDIRYKAILVDDSSFIDTSLLNVYSGTVSLTCIRLALFLAELNS